VKPIKKCYSCLYYKTVKSSDKLIEYVFDACGLKWDTTALIKARRTGDSIGLPFLSIKNGDCKYWRHR